MPLQWRSLEEGAGELCSECGSDRLLLVLVLVLVLVLAGLLRSRLAGFVTAGGVWGWSLTD